MMIKKENDWQGIVKSYEESGLPPGQFCQDKDISVSKLRYYRNKFKQGTKVVSSVKDDLFEPLLITPLHTTKANFKLVIHLPNKIRCELEVIDNRHQLLLLKELMTLC